MPVHGCLHFKSACTALDAETLLVNPAWIDTAPLRPGALVPVPPAETFSQRRAARRQTTSSCMRPIPRCARSSRRAANV